MPKFVIDTNGKAKKKETLKEIMDSFIKLVKKSGLTVDDIIKNLFKDKDV